MNRVIALFGATLDERLTNIIACILCATLPILYALASTAAHQ